MKTLRGALWRLRAPLSVLALGGAGAVVLLFADPNQPDNLLPKCPFKWLTGLDCPGCGMTRMAHALLHGDVVAAWNFNAAMLVVGVPFFVWLFARWIRASWTGQPRQIPKLVPGLVIAFALVWGVGRNLAGI
ncbi:hypothetical protein BBK82_24770 [Lentzea guizhouensis]|uniref:DUF2752 domain-containing protein n=1 Tax=Lentzea guizhouensis TaxID=1586287 RepID=A0A1B2HM51_9PSEU|nr:DUF2752 domain-containing protein [Lentzea guizhouensis]ANZ38798.1 hypothetical protein BBK82_24770 [Lentzea guizhouensis]